MDVAAILVLSQTVIIAYEEKTLLSQRVRKWLLFVIWASLLFGRATISLAGQTRHPEKELLTPPPAPSFAGMTHTSWTRRDGAPGSVSSLAQTKDGYLWIGSTLGLYRFDGLHFSPYPFSSGEPELPSLDVASLAADLDGGLWVAMRNSKVAHLKADGSRVFYDRNSGVNVNAIDRITCLPDASVWISGGSKLLRLEGDRWVDFGAGHGLGSGGVFSVFFDREGGIWIGRDKRLSLLKKGQPQFADVPTSVHYVCAMAQSRTGEIWISDAWRSVRPLSDKSPDGVLHLKGKAEMLLDDEDSLWIAHDVEGLTRIAHISEPGGVRSLEHASINHLTAFETHAILQDREGNIWVGTERGLDRYQKTPFVHLRSTELRHFPSLVAGDDGSVWINSHGSPLMRVVDGVTTPMGNHVNSGPLAKRRNGDICFADLTSYELQCYGKTGSAHIKMPDSLKHAPPLGLIEDNDGSLLFSFQGNGFWRKNDSAWERMSAPGLSKSSPWAMLSDSRGRLWLGYGENKVVKRQDGVYQTLTIDEGTWGNTLVFYEAAGTIWAAGSNGLCFLDGERFRRVHTFEPELLRGISGVVLDDFKNLWLNAGAGALRISSDEITRVLRDPGHLVKASVFDENDGLVGQPTQFKRVPSAVVDTRGRLWFATGGDVVSLDPKALGNNRAIPSVLIESVLIDGKSALSAPGMPGAVLHTDAARLHDLEINYIGINLSAPERVYYRYRLVAEDKTWQEAGKRRQAFYTRLSPGSYDFMVSASSGEDWSDLPVPLRIEVRPAFYQTWWFTALGASLALALVWLFWRARIRFATEQVHSRLAERLAERERVARELHDTLLQGFQGLMMRFHLAAQSIPDAEAAKFEMEGALDAADLLLIESRNRIRDLRYAALEPASLALAINALGDGFAIPHTWVLDVVTLGVPRELNPVSYQEIYAVAKEAVVNAFHHSHATNIRVEISFGANMLSVVVCDNGIGIDLNALNSRNGSDHWGLAGMQERAANLRADLKISTPPGGGTEIKLLVPATIAYQRAEKDSWLAVRYRDWAGRFRRKYEA